MMITYCRYCNRPLNYGQMCSCAGAMQAYYGQYNQPRPQQPNPTAVRKINSEINEIRQSGDEVRDNQNKNNAPPSPQYYNSYTQPPPNIPYQPPQYTEYRQTSLPVKNPPSLSFFDFIGGYIKSPNAAVEKTAEKKDLISVIICAVLYLFSSSLVQLNIGFGIGGMYALFPFFGFLFGAFGIIMPFVTNLITIVCTKQEKDAGFVLYSVILHTPIVSVMLLLTTIFGLLCFKAWLFMLAVTAVVYALSMGSLWSCNADKEKSSLVTKLLAFTIICGFILVFGVLILIEAKCSATLLREFFENIIYSNIMKLF